MNHVDLNLKKKRKASRGFSLVEVVIAMAVITVVTVSAISLVLSGNTVTARSNRLFEAQTAAKNVIECFKVTDDFEGKESAFCRALNYFSSSIDYESGSASTYSFAQYTLDYSTFVLRATVYYDDAAQRDRIFIYVTEKESNDRLFQIEYEKGGQTA